MGESLSILFCEDGVGEYPLPTPSLEYFAGFFDGEGHVSIGKSGTVVCGLTQNDPTILHLAQREYGGRIRSKPGTNGHGWVLASARGVLDFLEDIRPYLVVKAEEADIAMECAKLIRSDNLGCNPLTASEWAERNRLRDALLCLRPKKTASHDERLDIARRNRIKEQYNYCCSDCSVDISNHPLQSQVIMDDRLFCRKCFMRIVQPIRIKYRTKEQVVEALDSSKSVDEAAGKLGINRSSLYTRRKHYGLLTN